MTAKSVSIYRNRLTQAIMFKLTGKAEIIRVEHRLQHGNERKHLWTKREICQQNPGQACIIEIDGMDQRKTELPRVADRSKALDRCEVVKNHVVGVLVNGCSFSVVTHNDHWKRGANLTLSVLFQALKKIPTPWPQTLYLQLDNCVAENKNNTVFFLMALLVHRNVFKMVRISFHSMIS